MKHSGMIPKPFVVVLLSAIFLSCGKRDNPDPARQTLLERISTNSQTTTYTYDDNNRAIRFDAVFTNPVSNYSGFYTYNNSGQLTEVLYETSGDDIKSLYFYNGSGQITKIETYLISGGVETFDAQSAAIYTTPGKISVYETPGGAAPYLYVEYFLDAKGNIERQLTYNPAGSLLVTTVNSDFDDKHAPALSVPKTGFVRNVNNYGTVTVTPAGSSASIGTYTYEYNSDGYPTKRTTNTGSITTYEYIKK